MMTCARTCDGHTSAGVSSDETLWTRRKTGRATHLGRRTQRLFEELDIGRLLDADRYVLHDLDLLAEPALRVAELGIVNTPVTGLGMQRAESGYVTRTDDSMLIDKAGYDPSPVPCGPLPPFFASLIVTLVASCRASMVRFISSDSQK